jgi:16S rRNA (uracil1498-N3)-methyltransferase
MRVLIQRGGCLPGGWDVGRRVGLDEQEIQHLKVRRARDGEKVELLDGAGLQGAGTLVRVGRGWAVDVTASQHTRRPPALTLAVAAGDRERFSWMVEKAVELGVTNIVPLETARTAGVATGLKYAHIGRLRRSALESTKQCGVAWAPEIEDILPLLEFLGQPLAGTGWLADQGGDAAPSSMEEGTPLSVVIGPEGGLTDAEREAAVMAGYRLLALGRHTLRFETAALAAAVVVNQARMRSHHG